MLILGNSDKKYFCCSIIWECEIMNYSQVILSQFCTSYCASYILTSTIHQYKLILELSGVTRKRIVSHIDGLLCAYKVSELHISACVNNNLVVD